MLVLCGDPHRIERPSVNVTHKALSFPWAKAKKESTLSKPNSVSRGFPGTPVGTRASNNYREGEKKDKPNQGASGPMWSLDTSPERDEC